MTVFWDCEGPLLVDFLPHKRTITGLHCWHNCAKPSRKNDVGSSVLEFFYCMTMLLCTRVKL